MNLTTKPLPGSGNSSGPDSSPLGTLTPAASLMSSPVISPATPSATSSPGSADGALPYSWQDGLPTDLFGPGVAPASPSAAPASSSVPPMNATFGPPSSISSASAALAGYLASRLKARLGTAGLIPFRQTWKEKVTPAGRRYWAHIASVPRTGGNDCIGWPTPITNDAEKRGVPVVGAGLAGACHMVPWPTATTRDAKGREGQPSKEKSNGRRSVLAEVAHTAPWSTRRATDGSNGGPNQAGGALSADAQTVSPWATPTTRDHKDGDCDLSITPDRGLLGRQVLNSSPAPTGKRGSLNPEFSLWLMGFPPEWVSCGVAAMPSSRKSRRSSSKQQSK